MTELIQINQYPVSDVLSLLLKDKTTGDNIIFATDTYLNYGYTERDCMSDIAVIGFSSCDIQPRVLKAQAAQNERTRKKAEVFTPTWICNLMNNHIDNEWFGSEDIFNRQQEREWKETTEKIAFPKNKNWKKYVDSRRLEITCGEAPYIASRYDATTGELIPIERRIGLLDRKLRIVGENTDTEEEWLKWAVRAFQSVYGYEFQGDNLLIARINLLVTFCDYLYAKWQRKATKEELRKIANIISWNIWQMDGLSDTVPFSKKEGYVQMSFLEKEVESQEKKLLFCKIQDWRGKCYIILKNLKDKDKRGVNMKFDYVIGNPPYQEDRQGESTTALPIYHLFMDAAYSVSDIVTLIHPARFLFNAGRTPKQWNEKMLNDSHLKIIMYENDASKIFPNTDIKGGVVVSHRNANEDYGAIKTFTIFPELNIILKKIMPYINKNSFADLAFVATKFNTENLFCDYPQYVGHERRMSSNVLNFDCFSSEETSDDDIKIYGIYNKHRDYKFISKKYVDIDDKNLEKYKIVMPKADGNGDYGSTITSPEILSPKSGFTHTFLGIGGFDTEYEATSVLKYVKTKFARALLGVLKVTQDLNADKWMYVPIQDFTSDSDIDWDKSVFEIDQQLYKKYNLSQEEIVFIETHVKEMT